MISALYRHLPRNCEELLHAAINRGLGKGNAEARIFFRADDIGVPGTQFSELIALFQKHQLPLCLAVVPSWLSRNRFDSLSGLTGTPDSSQWCWHQHGWLHKNHERQGKKQEFGPARDATAQVSDLSKGRDRLQQVMGQTFAPYFTPPWNRCSMATMEGLVNLDFHALSRSWNAKPQSPEKLPDLQVNVDLHTRKESDPAHSLDMLLVELEEGICSGRAGIMLHHQRMNAVAGAFLDLLLKAVLSFPKLHPVRFQELL